MLVRQLPATLILALSFSSLSGAEAEKKPTKPSPGTEPADIWILAGQSNMGGWGLLKTPIEPDLRIMAFRNGEWSVAKEPMHDGFVSPGWDRNGKLSPRPNILMQRNNI